MHESHPILAAMLTATTLLAGCNSADLAAQRIDRPLTIDGDPSDWGSLIVELDDADYDFGYANDDDDLYLCLIAAGDAVRRQALAGGVYLWFDPAGGEERALGLHYPVGVGAPAAGAGPPTSADRDAAQAQFEERAAASLQSVALLSPQGSTEIPLADLRGIAVNSLLTSGSLVVELRIPLRAVENADLALGMDPTTTQVGLELFVPELQAPARTGGRARDGAGGGGPRGMGGGGRGGGSRGTGPRPRPSGADEIREQIIIPLALSGSSELNPSR